MELYVLANVDENGKFAGFPKGGGSLTQPRIRAYETLAAAKRGKRHHNGTIVKLMDGEVIE